MRVLVACEESQRVCISFCEKGHEAYSCDILDPSGGRPEWHIKGDVLAVINGGEFVTMDGKKHVVDKWDLMIAFPPCTYMSAAGACRMYPRKGELDRARLEKAMAAKQFFETLLNADIPRIAIENPRPLKIVGLPEPSQWIQPYYFDEPYSKLTGLWLKDLPQLKPTDERTDYKPFVSCGTSRNKGNKDKAGYSRAGGAQIARSKIFWGIARAMAEQWG